MPNFKGWWEYYFLRYFVGTVVGAVVIFLNGRTTFEYLFPVEAEWKFLTGLTALGFAYCYIASAPMLTLHVIRVYLFKHPSFESIARWESKGSNLLWLWWPIPLLLITAALTCTIFQIWPGFSKWQTFCPVLLFLFIPAVQIISLCKAYKDKFATLSLFYVELSTARAEGREKEEERGAETKKEKEKKVSLVTEYVESYRHMREHSNAYAIIILELIFATVLPLIQDKAQLIPILTIWLLPPACCWWIATVLEVKLADDKLT